MRPLPAVARAVAALVLFSLATAGCSGSTDSGQPKPSVKPQAKSTQGAGEVAYYRCMEDQGIPLDTTDDGSLRIEKGADNEAAALAAEKECASLHPSPPAMVPATKEDMARARKLSACLREHGVKDYPDPAPNGDFGLSDELAHAMKTNPDYREARRVCDPRPAGDPVVGG
ncbi:hypothetical protein E6P78_01340 [Streptomyces sp. A0958]|uniref:hypothetical protein n=1 Tax=Streptomyces sp. A0958 TaxID=2563101 RepID=UPI00109E9C17|nr:hypothetical protein [Streptomyces sp. A0958]THA72812.1 hypothetical protein E6P78_01340 [Streptomyces sp. A0958]